MFIYVYIYVYIPNVGKVYRGSTNASRTSGSSSSSISQYSWSHASRFEALSRRPCLSAAAAAFPEAAFLVIACSIVSCQTS